MAVMAKLSRKITYLITAKVKRFLTLPAVYSVVLTSVIVTGILLGVRSLGVLQTLELAVYDQMVRWQPDAAPRFSPTDRGDYRGRHSEPATSAFSR